MAPRNENKTVNKDLENDENSSVYWLKKIYEKFEIFEKSNKSAIEKLEQQIGSLVDEVQSVKTTVAQIQPIVNQGTASKSGVSEDNSVFETNETTRKEFFAVLNKRKHAYYKKLRSSDIALVYREFLKEAPPFIPRKFRENHIPGESDKQGERIAALEITKLQIECERLEEEVSKQETELKNLESEVGQIISKENCPEKRQQVKEIWIKKIGEEEKVSQTIWKKKKVFFENLKNADGQRGNHSNERSKSTNNFTNSRRRQNSNFELERGPGRRNWKRYDEVENWRYNGDYRNEGNQDKYVRSYNPKQFFRGRKRGNFERYSRS